MTTLASVPCPQFDLSETLDSGQVFHWHLHEGPAGGFFGCIGKELVWVHQRGDLLEVLPQTMSEEVRRYFRLDQDHRAILDSMPTDPALQAAIAYCPGLRIIRQPAWECLTTFITSSLKQVEHIRQISLQLRARYGEEHRLTLPDGIEVQAFSYPSPTALAEAGEGALRECRLGYRAKSLHLAAQRLTENPSLLNQIQRLSTDEARTALSSFYGVGEKIADCVLLFSFDRLSAFPIDVWIERVLRQSYQDEGPWNAKATGKAQLAAFAKAYFGEHGGYAQQFLFHFARKTSRRTPDS